MAAVTLFDMARKGGNNCWSPNTWKTRLILNYKGIPYRTEWLTHPEIEPKLEQLGISPNQPGPGPPGSPYSLPAIRLPGGTYVMDSLAIAEALESRYPSPPLHLDNNLHKAIGPVQGKFAIPLLPTFMPRIGRDIVPESAMDYFHQTRSKRFGMSMDELEKQKGGPQAWIAAKPGLDELEELVAKQKRDEGPFMLGSEVCYADFVIAALMESLRRIGPDLYEGFARERSALKELHEACGKWMENDR